MTLSILRDFNAVPSVVCEGVGTIGTKPRAAAWAIQQLDPRWRPLIQSAFAWQVDETMDEVALIETIRFLQYATAKEAIL